MTGSDDNSINTTKWDYGWDRVLESDGIMKVETTVTDGGGRLWSKWIDISPNNTITITRKANLHYSNNYFNGTLRMLFDTNNDGIPDIGFGVEYANDLYATGQYCPRYGFYIIRNSFGCSDGSYLCSKKSDISESIEPVWDTWFDEKIIYNTNTGVLEYFITVTTRPGWRSPVPEQARMGRFRRVSPGPLHDSQTMAIAQSPTTSPA